LDTQQFSPNSQAYCRLLYQFPLNISKLPCHPSLLLHRWLKFRGCPMKELTVDYSWV